MFSAAPAPSAAAAAGAAAAALLQRQLAQDSGGQPDAGWVEHQTGDGRKFFYHEGTRESTWEKPDSLKSPEERANQTPWREYRIWDGRVFYHNRETKVSCWAVPPELRKLRGEGTGLDDRPLPETTAERRRAFWELMKERGIDENWNWRAVDEETREDPRARFLPEELRKQTFAELLSLCLKRTELEEREKERSAAGALAKLMEERFHRPEDLASTYEDAAERLGEQEPWKLMRSDVRRDEVFQTVLERLEQRHQKERVERRAARVVRLQRLIATDPQLKCPKTTWREAEDLLASRDEIQEENPPLEALRVWASLKHLKHIAEYEAEVRSKERAAKRRRSAPPAS